MDWKRCTSCKQKNKLLSKKLRHSPHTLQRWPQPSPEITPLRRNHRDLLRGGQRVKTTAFKIRDVPKVQTNCVHTCFWGHRKGQYNSVTKNTLTPRLSVTDQFLIFFYFCQLNRMSVVWKLTINRAILNHLEGSGYSVQHCGLKCFCLAKTCTWHEVVKTK